jgi:hypothetical protein
MKKLFTVIFDFIMRNLEFYPLCFALLYWFDSGFGWKYITTIFLVALCSGISTSYNINKALKNK